MPTTTKKKTSAEILAELRAKQAAGSYTANDFSTQLAALNQQAQAKAQPAARTPSASPTVPTADILRPVAKAAVPTADVLRDRKAGIKSQPWEAEPKSGWDQFIDSMVAPDAPGRQMVSDIGGAINSMFSGGGTPAARVPETPDLRAYLEQTQGLRPAGQIEQTITGQPTQADNFKQYIPYVDNGLKVNEGLLAQQDAAAKLGTPTEFMNRKMNPVTAVSEQWDATSDYYEPTVQQAKDSYAAETDLSPWDDPIGFVGRQAQGFLGSLADAGSMIGGALGWNMPIVSGKEAEAILEEQEGKPVFTYDGVDFQAVMDERAGVSEMTGAANTERPSREEQMFADVLAQQGEDGAPTASELGAATTETAGLVFGSAMNIAGAGTYAASALFPFLGATMANIRYGVLRGALYLSEADDALMSTPLTNPYDVAQEYRLRREAAGKPLTDAELDELFAAAAQYSKDGGITLSNMSLYDLYAYTPYTMGQVMQAGQARDGKAEYGISDIAYQSAQKYRSQMSPNW